MTLAHTYKLDIHVYIFEHKILVFVISQLAKYPEENGTQRKGKLQ